MKCGRSRRRSAAEVLSCAGSLPLSPDIAPGYDRYHFRHRATWRWWHGCQFSYVSRPKKHSGLPDRKMRGSRGCISFTRSPPVFPTSREGGPARDWDDELSGSPPSSISRRSGSLSWRGWTRTPRELMIEARRTTTAKPSSGCHVTGSTARMRGSHSNRPASGRKWEMLRCFRRSVPPQGRSRPIRSLYTELETPSVTPKSGGLASLSLLAHSPANPPILTTSEFGSYQESRYHLLSREWDPARSAMWIPGAGKSAD